MSVPLRKDDPAYWMLEKGVKAMAQNPDNAWVTRPVDGIFRSNCYICIDPEFGLMGLPLCYACIECGGHVPADDVDCENGHSNYSLDLEEELA
jgi:hypothetical protein